MAKKSKKTNLLNRSVTFSYKQMLIFVAAFGIIAAWVLIQTYAAPSGKGGGKGGTSYNGSIDLLMKQDNNGNGLPNWNDRVTFNVSTTATDRPYVNLKCYVGGSLVSQGTEGFFAGSLDDGVFGLSSPMWTSGPAECTATLQMIKPKGNSYETIPITSINFHVDA